ncbi:hypothetical protein [Azospirillum soli]|uniref:hypothetical protein n=1 Tax=Azospirillum soli TaxID=1304799 RepID=UPI001AE41785|nr:hypothetical protein [Azospirillum soli]MBP2314266.1 hypothetical protein [Azospirillum soli]
MIRVNNGVIHLEGHCPVEDAEPLLEALQAGGDAALELGGCGSVHTAVLQLLLASRTRVLTPPADALLARLLRNGRAPDGTAPEEVNPKQAA